MADFEQDPRWTKKFKASKVSAPEVPSPSLMLPPYPDDLWEQILFVGRFAWGRLDYPLHISHELRANGVELSPREVARRNQAYFVLVEFGPEMQKFVRTNSATRVWELMRVIVVLDFEFELPAIDLSKDPENRSYRVPMMGDIVSKVMLGIQAEKVRTADIARWAFSKGYSRSWMDSSGVFRTD